MVQAKIFSRENCSAPAICKWRDPKEIVNKIFIPEDVSDDRDMLNAENPFSYSCKNLSIRGTEDSKWFVVGFR
jgi:hypothetical protein